MRVTGLFLALALVACAGKARPAVMPRLESLPDDPQRRNERLDSTNARPEGRRPMSRKMQQAETVAATAAAIVGSIFSTTKTVLIGVGGSIEENDLVSPVPASRPEKAEPAPTEPEYDPNQLVPWIKVGQEPGTQVDTPAPDTR